MHNELLLYIIMTFKKFLRYIAFILMIGASLTLGFLSFTGIYVIFPIIPLAIAAFFLSVVFEGEIYYQNITSAFKSLLKPDYLKRKIAEECLQEAIADIQYIQDDLKLINSIQEFAIALGDIRADIDAMKAKHKLALDLYNKQKKLSKNPHIQDLLKDNNFLSEKDLNEILGEEKNKNNENKLITFGQSRAKELSKARRKNSNNLNELANALNTKLPPKFFTDYARIAKISHIHSHFNLDDNAKESEECLQISLTLLERIFYEQLFYDEAKENKKQQDRAKRFNSNSIKKMQAYEQELRNYIDRYKNKYKQRLPQRNMQMRFAQALSIICAICMSLGTSYLLTEAFAIIPILATIPFGILPAVILPMATIAGIAYGVLTYNALDQLINSDIIANRINKIKEDLKDLTAYKALKIFTFSCLIGLAITLTVCTGGTWYTVVKHTRPIFVWLKKMPAAMSGIIAAILATSAFAFNLGNEAQTYEELEELAESVAPENHPYNLDLLELKNDSTLKLVTRPAIIKKQDKYIIYGCKSHTERELRHWQQTTITKDSYLSYKILSFLDFATKKLNFSMRNMLIYLVIKLNNAHIFTPNKENFYQSINPFRFFLLLTYVPLRVLFFIGHLISISATADRIPNVPEIVSILVSFIAELFEDLHYFLPFEHAHKEDLNSIINERFKLSGGCNHNDDFPTYLLREIIFLPFFMLAAWYHSITSDKKTIHKTLAPSVSYEDALEMMQGKKTKSSPNLSTDEKNLVCDIQETITATTMAYSVSHKNQVESKSDIEEQKDSPEILLARLSILKHKKSHLSIFEDHNDCNGCTTQSAKVPVNEVVLQT